MAQNTKQIVSANAFAQRLKLRLASSYVITQSFDASNNPCVLVNGSGGAIATDNLLVQFTGSTSTYANILGQTEDFVSTPTILNVYNEGMTTSPVALWNTAAFQAQTQIELAKIYGIQKVYVANNGTTLSVGALSNTLTTAASLVSTVVPELQPGSGMAAG